MLMSYIKGSFLSIKKNIFNSFNAIINLSIGYLVFLLLLSFCMYYYQYDRNNVNKHWYRIRTDKLSNGKCIEKSAEFNADLLPIIKKEIPEIKDDLIIKKNQLEARFVNTKGNIVPIGQTPFSSVSIINYYNLKFLHGDPLNSLVENPLIISKSFAIKYFGKVNVVGEPLKLFNKTFRNVNGVFDDIPQNVHYWSDSFVLYKDEYKDKEKLSGMSHVCLFIPQEKDIKLVENKINNIIKKFKNSDQTINSCHLDPVCNMHYIQDLINDKPTSNKYLVLACFFVSLLLLIAVYLNSINLNTLIWQKRLNEFIFRKTLGASGFDLFKQLLTEFSIVNVISFGLFFILYYYLRDLFGLWINHDLREYYLFKNSDVSLIFFSILILGFVISLIPIIKFSNYKNIREQDRVRNKKSGNNLILCFQTAISTLFILSSLIVYTQINKIKNLDLGFDTKNLIEYKYMASNNISFPITSIEALKLTLSKFNEIDRYSTSINSCINTSYSSTSSQIKIDDKEYNSLVNMNVVSEDYFKVMKIKILQGETSEFKPFKYTDNVLDIAINNTFKNNFFAKENPIGKKFVIFFSDGYNPVTYSVTVKAVISDVKNQSLFNKTLPSFYILSPDVEYIQVFYKDGQKESLIKKLDLELNKLSKDYFYYPKRIDVKHEINKFYEHDVLFMNLIILLAILCSLITFLGIYSISSLHIFSNLKEIAIYKVNGAEFKHIYQIYFIKYFMICIEGYLAGSILAYFILDMFLSRFTIIISHLWFFYLLCFTIMMVLVNLPVFFIIKNAYKKSPSKYLNNE